MASLYDIFKQNQYDLKSAARQSNAWFQQQVRILNAKNPTPNKVMRSTGAKPSNQVIPGSLYMFLYDPKTKETLPYYDVFPLVFPFKKVPGGFLGLNMHYLPYAVRVKLLDRLLQFANDETLSENTRIRFSWATISGMSKFKIAEPCVKHYLTSHVRSTYRKIGAPDWATAMLLPVEQFVGAGKAKVWEDSMA
jgi:hypothetical protein